MEGLTEGRIVHFVIPGGEHRPAIVVNAWHNVSQYQDEARVNLRVFLDGKNDVRHFSDESRFGDLDLEKDNYMLWATSVEYSETPRVWTWHWIERA